MKMKYLMYEVVYAGVDPSFQHEAHITDVAILRRIPIVFFDPVVHLQMHETLEVGEALPPRSKLVSAGFISFSSGDQVSVWGESESLKGRGLAHKPLPEDLSVFRTYDFAHGVI